MKGVLFLVLQEAIEAEHGPDTWDDLLDSAQVDGAYTSLGSYPDEQFDRLLHAAAQRQGKPADEVQRAIGRRMLPILARRCPAIVEPRRTTRDLLLALNGAVHAEVRKLYPGAEVPTLELQTSTRGQLVLGYRSARRLCSFAEGLIEGAGDHYGEPVRVKQSVCVKRGSATCLFVVDLGTTDRVTPRGGVPSRPS